MSDAAYQYYQLPEKLADQFSFDPTPFPVRAEMVNSIFGPDHVSLDGLLDEADHFCTHHPEHAAAIQPNAAHLAMICATHHAFDNDFAAALEALNRGLRVDPQHRGLKAHQALALQLNNYPEAAAAEYEQLLWDAPQAYDPLIRALAAKAFSDIGDHQKALELLEVLPERAFQDPSLKELRKSLREQSGAASDGRLNFCAGCGHKLKPTANFCTNCGQAVS